VKKIFLHYRVTFKRSGEGQFVAPDQEGLLFSAIQSALGLAPARAREILKSSPIDLGDIVVSLEALR
jgi:hypothetical protein